MNYSKTQHEAARQEAANLIAKALQILQDANNQAMAAQLWSLPIPETRDAIRSIRETAKYTLPPPTETK